MIVAAVSTKYLAAVMMKKTFGYSDAQTELMFGLSNTQAAGTLAIIMVAVKLELFPSVFIDAAVILMLVTCIISAIYTEKGARKIASEQKVSKADTKHIEIVQENILLLLSNPFTVPKLIDLALMMKNEKTENPIYPLTLVVDGNNNNTGEEIARKQKLLEQAQEHASATNQLTHLITRVDVNVASGVKLAAKEYGITHTILGWNGSNGKSSFFGTILEHILDTCDSTIVSARTINDWYAVKRMFIFMSPNFQFEYKYLSVILPVLRIAVALKKVVSFYGTNKQFDEIMRIAPDNGMNIDFEFFDAKKENLHKFVKTNIRQNDFSVILCGRKSSVSFDDEYRKLPDYMSSHFPKDNFLQIFPPMKEKNVRTLSKIG
jgi:hypothetical protein